MRVLLLLLLAVLPAQAREPYLLQLTLVHFANGGWREEEIVAAATQAVAILGQCAIKLGKMEVLRVDAEPRFRFFHTPSSRELARKLRPRTPAIYFVDGSRQEPAFDAEAIGRGNSRGRPELRDSVWVVHGARDLEITIAHELAHVLMDSGEHSVEPGNLMRDETAPGSQRLTDAQCARLREAGTANGLLAPVR